MKYSGYTWLKILSLPFFRQLFGMIMGTHSITHMAQPVFLLGNLASVKMRRGANLCLVSEEGADEGEDNVSHTWQGPGGKQISERIQGKEAPRDDIFHLLLLKCVGLEM